MKKTLLIGAILLIAISFMLSEAIAQQPPLKPNPKLHGLIKDYYESGGLLAETNYKNGVLDGPSKSYYENGTLRDEISYKNNLVHGAWKTYAEDGTLISEMNFQMGKRLDKEGNLFTGLSELKDQYGNVLSRANYVDGLVEGESVDYDASGVVVRKNVFRNGKPVSMRMYYKDTPNNVAYCDFTFGDRQELDGPSECYYPDGTINAESVYRNNILNGPSKLYYQNGNLEAELTYVNGVVKGLVKRYFENGNLKSEEHY